MSTVRDTQRQSFAENSQRALTNAPLQRALTIATGKATNARHEAVTKVGAENWEQLRERAHAIKEHTINNLDFYLEKFSANVERAGGNVFWAGTADEACRYIAELAHRHGVKEIVKSKSMMTEEIGLNRALAEAGIKAIETDLGEYIVQLADERPSHINMPAIHKTRGQVADLFAEKLGVERTEEITEMTTLARRVLRARFAEARMGVTGVNYAIADTGTIVLVENEGNIRLTTSLPRVHVAIMGIEKVIPGLQDLDVFLKLLSRSASGQKMCSYVSLLTGIKSSPAEEGPDEFHVVLIDNGRVEILGDEHLRESLYCIRCGACLNVCPVYRKIGGHAYGWVYPGPIGAVLTPQMIGLDRAAALPFASSLCGACGDVCPVKIKLPNMLLHLRHEIKAGGHVRSRPESPARGAQSGSEARDSAHDFRHQSSNSDGQSALARSRERLRNVFEAIWFKLWAVAMRNSRSYRYAARLGRLVQAAVSERNSAGSFVLRVPRWSVTRDFPPLARRSFREQWLEQSGISKASSVKKEPTLSEL
jgi:L-lactate dehydrogenase complex protein LldF